MLEFPHFNIYRFDDEIFKSRPTPFLYTPTLVGDESNKRIGSAEREPVMAGTLPAGKVIEWQHQAEKSQHSFQSG